MDTNLEKIDKYSIRQSLKASTLDGVFASVFTNATGGVLLTKFLLDLNVSTLQIGLLASIPMVVNFLQPLGAFLADRMNSRYRYCQAIYGISRLLWLILGLTILFVPISDHFPPQNLVYLTLAIILTTNILCALGGSAWMSWMATIVPKRLRGRYFGLRNSLSSLSSLISVPLMGMIISYYPLGPVRGYGVIVLIGVIMGLISLGFQHFMVDVDPQKQHPTEPPQPPTMTQIGKPNAATPSYSLTLGFLSQISNLVSKNSNFFIFVLYYDIWMFAINLSMPFFSVYLLKGLHLDVSLVTVYASIQAGTYMIALPLWGRLADRTGNRALILLVGMVVATIPLFWMHAHPNSFTFWVLLPFLHCFAGATLAAIDLCNQNLQLALAPIRNQATYFAITSASTGISGALGATTGGLLSHFFYQAPNSLLVLFALSSMFMLTALLPLTFTTEPGGHSAKLLFKKLLSSMGLNWRVATKV